MSVQSSSLDGRCFVVTRPQEQADSLCLRLEQAGAEAFRFPVLAISAAADHSELEAIVPRLDEFDLAFFVSPNAVRHALAFIQSRRTWPQGLRTATVGKGSERVLNEHGFLDAVAPQDGFDSEAVLALPEFSTAAVKGRKVLIFRGDGGRNLLRDSLRARGAQVELVCCYQRQRPQLDSAPLLARAAQGALDGLLLTSTEGVGNLVAMVGAEGMTKLADIAVFASHPRIAAAARGAGFVTVIETAAGDDGLMQALIRHFG